MGADGAGRIINSDAAEAFARGHKAIYGEDG